MERINRNQLRPLDTPGLIRLGARRDGGYVVPEAQVREATVLLSLGIKDNWTFERDFVALNGGVRVIGVDRSVGPLWFGRRIVTALFHLATRAAAGDRRNVRRHGAVLRNAIDYFRFFAGPHRHVRRWVSTRDTGSEITLTSLLSMVDAREDHRVFLKIDVEGAEYALVPDIVAHQGRIGCLVAEFHALGRKGSSFNQSIERLLRHFCIVHIHGNNYAPCDEQGFPAAVEITFVHRALLAGAPPPSRHDYPRPDLDYPNHPGRPDCHLRFD